MDTTTQPRKLGRPKVGPPRCVRVPDELWDNAHIKAQQRGLDLADVIRALLRLYVARRPVSQKLSNTP